MSSSSPSLDRNNLYRQTCPSASSRYDSPSLSTFSTTQSQPLLSCHTTSLHPLQCTSTAAASTLSSNRPVENDDEPLYDSVASEDDYSSWERRRKIQNQQEVLTLQTKARSTLQDTDYQEVVSRYKYDALINTRKRQLTNI